MRNGLRNSPRSAKQPPVTSHRGRNPCDEIIGHRSFTDLREFHDAKKFLPGYGHPIHVNGGFNLIARCAGLVGQLLEEMVERAGYHIWKLADEGVPYRKS